jgi:hypothetical protein
MCVHVYERSESHGPVVWRHLRDSTPEEPHTLLLQLLLQLAAMHTATTAGCHCSMHMTCELCSGLSCFDVTWLAQKKETCCCPFCRGFGIDCAARTKFVVAACCSCSCLAARAFCVWVPNRLFRHCVFYVELVFVNDGLSDMQIS